MGTDKGQARPTPRQVSDSTAATEASMEPQRVPVNVYETAGSLVVIAPLAAVTPADVTVELRRNELRFYASLRSAGPREYLIHEWEYGGYEREVEVPAGYGSGLEASLTNGQLVVRVRKGEPAGDITIHPSDKPADKSTGDKST